MISSDFFASFEDMLVAERGASRNTLAAYGRDLLDCLDYLRRQDSARPVVLATASRSQLEAYFAALARGGFAPQTRARRRVSLRQYFQFLVAEGLREDNPMTLIDAPSLGRPLPKTLAPATIERLLAQATAEASHRGTGPHPDRKPEKLAARACRMVLQLELLWGSGVRVSEMLGLMPSSFRPREGLVLVIGKGGKERLIPVTDHSLAALANYMTVRKAYFLREGQESKLLFVQRGDAKPQSRTDFWRELKLLAERAGIDPSQVSPHRFRHSCATAMLVGGANLREVQTMLGHSDLVTTEIYTHLAIDQLQELVETHHPLAHTKFEPSR